MISLYINSDGFWIDHDKCRAIHSVNEPGTDSYTLMWQTFNDALEYASKYNLLDGQSLSIYSDQRIIQELLGEVEPLSYFGKQSLLYFTRYDLPRTINFQVFKLSKEQMLKNEQASTGSYIS